MTLFTPQEKRVISQLPMKYRVRAIKARLEQGASLNETPWQERLPKLFPRYVWHEFGERHAEMWQWVETIDTDTSPRPFCAFWPRGSAKSTNGEMATVDVGVREKRLYGLYVCETQDQADKHVATISSMLESEAITKHYPRFSRPRLGKNGSRSWNRNIVATDGGYTVEAIGLNKAVRGQKIDWARPDWIVFDDIDALHDSDLAIKKKIEIITGSILPAGSDNVAVLFLQNLIHRRSIATMLSKRDGGATFLADRLISGPYKAIEGLGYEAVKQEDGSIRWRITSGLATWSGQSIEACEDEINRIGPAAFERELQHEIDTDNPNALLSSEDFERGRVTSHPDLATVIIAVDPPASTGSCGIVGGGKAKIGREWHGYTLIDATPPPATPPAKWAEAVLRAYLSLGAGEIICEVNNGGDMVENTIRNAELRGENGNVVLSGKNVKIRKVRASRGKVTRAEPVATVFSLGKAHHVGYFPELEKQWTTYEPGDDSPDRLDAEVWLYAGLGFVEDEKQARAI